MSDAFPAMAGLVAYPVRQSFVGLAGGEPEEWEWNNDGLTLVITRVTIASYGTMTTGAVQVTNDSDAVFAFALFDPTSLALFANIPAWEPIPPTGIVTAANLSTTDVDVVLSGWAMTYPAIISATG